MRVDVSIDVSLPPPDDTAAGSLPQADRARAGLVAEVAPARDGAVGLALVLALAEGLALVVLALALGDGDLDLGPAVGEVDLEGDERVAALLGLVADLHDLVLVQQQLALAPGRVVVPRA